MNILTFIKKYFGWVRLKPITVAAKCRLQFGSAVILIIFLTLLIPHYWIGKLTEKSALDIGRTILNVVRDNNFQLDKKAVGKGVMRVKDSVKNADVNDLPVRWIRIGKDPTVKIQGITKQQQEIIGRLLEQDKADDFAWVSYKTGLPYNNYLAIVRAGDVTLGEQVVDPTMPSNLNEPVGILIVHTPALEVSRTKLLNNLAIIVAGVLAGVGALIAFYVIAQRIILRPIRQLRALANNISEGNLDARSSIKTQDEYQNLSDAINSMLDGFQGSQEKLRQANAQLDAKIAELSDRNIELYRANKLKSEFLANMSHEFRTPLNAILGFAQILKEKCENDKNQRYAENITTSGRNLLAMINDLLELAKAEAGKMEVRLENTSVPDLCRGLVSFFAPMVENKKLQMELKLADDIPIVQTDPMKLQQILFNFVSNAIKFTPEQGRIELEALMADDKHIRISVSDTGPGISEKDRKAIFEKFRQTDSSITRKTTGTGLGLAISKELAALLAGQIGVDSKAGVGATFWVEIPVRIRLEIEETEANS